jgi:hypothetical protein
MAIEYLTAFAKSDTPVVFMPRGSQVQVSVDTGEIYAEYWLTTEAPLERQFAVQMRSLPAIAIEAGEADMGVELGSAVRFTASNSEWRILYCNIPETPRPTVNVFQTIHWGGDFGMWLALCQAATRATDERGCMDCVCVQQRSRFRAVVATDGSILAAHSESNSAEEGVDWSDASVLIENRHLSRVIRTCESGGQVSIDIGVRRFSVHCGHRRAVFSVREGVFPKWEAYYRESLRGIVGRDKHPATATMPPRRMKVAMRQTGRIDGPVQITGHNNGLRFESRTELGETDVIIDAEWGGSFGPISVSQKYIERIATNWPHQEIYLGYSGKGQPLVLSSRDSPETMAIIMPHV